MNWEAIGAVGEVLGAATVLITLGYLAVQIRQNTQVMQNSALGAALDFHRLFNRNERYIALLAKSQRKEELTLEDRAHMVERFLAIMRELESIWYHQQRGTLSQAIRTMTDEALRYKGIEEYRNELLNSLV